jgi:hypothetical protein
MTLPEEIDQKLFPMEAVTEIYFNSEWVDIKPTSYKEYTTTHGMFVSYVDPHDETIVFILDRLVQGWSIDPDLVVLEPENEEPQKELTE